jgi:hypothetical protein
MEWRGSAVGTILFDDQQLPDCHPGIPLRWILSTKSGVGTAGGRNRVWLTLSHGIVNLSRPLAVSGTVFDVSETPVFFM